MSGIDIIWVIVWLISGLIVFQTKGESKTLVTILSIIFSIISLLAIINNSSSFESIILFIGISKATGVLTTLSYLIGANISRYNRFNKMSSRIIYYIIGFIILWVLLDALI